MLRTLLPLSRACRALPGGRGLALPCSRLAPAARLTRLMSTPATTGASAVESQDDGEASVKSQDDGEASVDIHRKRPVPPLSFEKETLIFQSEVDMQEVA
eukprot:s4780_g1.t1